MRLTMWRAVVLGVLLGVLTLPSAEFRLLAQQQQPPIRVPDPQAPKKDQDQKDQKKKPEGEFGITVEVPLVNLEVVATDTDGNTITGLRKINFQVFEDGVQQQITNFSPTESAITTVMLIEFSKLGYEIFAYNALDWADQFTSQLKKDDWVALVSFDLRTRIEVDFTQNKLDIRNYLSHMIFPGFSEANLFDAVIETVDRIQDLKGRKSILVLASGLDTFSKHTLDDVLKRLRQTDVTIFSVGVAHAFANYMDAHRRLGDIGRLNFYQAENQLKSFAEMTGGRGFFAHLKDELPDIMREVAAFLRAQYSLGYSPSNQNRDGKFRKIKVVLVGDDGNPLVMNNQKGKKVKIVVYARQGYNAPKGGVSD